MTKNAIHITSKDMERLRRLLDKPDLMQQKPYLQELERELDRALVVEPTEIPADTVTMNSTIRLIQLETGDDMTLTLVYPDDADISQGKISVLAPVGTAALGCREGDKVEWEVPAGTQTFKVDKIIYQPEAAGEYTL